MTSDILVGLLIGGILVAAFNPYRGIYFHIRGLKQQLERFREKYPDTGESGLTYDKEYPNRKENT